LPFALFLLIMKNLILFNAKRKTLKANRPQIRIMHLAFSIMLFALSIFAFSCSSDNGGYKKADDAQDAGREFIRASLDGDYNKAEFYLLKDSTNVLLFQKQQSNYRQMSRKEKSSFKNATIRPVSITGENDSTIFYKYYHTSNPADTTTLRIVRRNGNWLVDLKSVIKM
jgi:hypothetical protein